ncbi:hypothetical protein [Oceanospirillum beijerinckii]|uniref:hypothetical protein n=1 Tax=Oceanospirillum beijerinckii TaxID=64976 RepID=UPI00041FFA58|nr:hypothetical protein [Oceanospirillum beijerinckii]
MFGAEIYAKYGQHIISNTFSTNSEGDFDISLKDGALLFPGNANIQLLINHRDVQYFHNYPSSEWNVPQLIKIKDLRANVSAKLKQQPLRSENSVSTFDVIISNKGVNEIHYSSISLSLKTTETDCSSIMKSGYDSVSSVIMVDLDRGVSTTGTAEPIVDKVYKSFYNKNLCADITVFQPISVPPKSTKRIRFDIQSTEARDDLNKYANGLGPYGSYSSDTGHVYQKTERLEKSDLRYYLIEGSIIFGFIDEATPKGKVYVSDNIEPGTFLSDVGTIKKTNKKIQPTAKSGG